MSEGVDDKQETAAALENADAKAMLENANSASERVAGLHVAFMAVCAYVLVIVFGTTDLDLLIGKSIKLPLVNVDVPIEGFYKFAPYLVVLAHFNLLLQLQLLSRKLFAFDKMAPQNEKSGGLHDRLHIFPYTYYLVGRPKPLVRSLVGVMVSITLVLLPLFTLVALQLQFLAYQSEAVTWWQRVAIGLDLTVIIILWPVILHPKDDWRDYWRVLIKAYLPRRGAWVVFSLHFVGFAMFLFIAGEWQFPDEPNLKEMSKMLLAFPGLVLLLLVSVVAIPICGLKTTSRSRVLFTIILVASSVISALLGYRAKSLMLLLLGPLLFLPLSVLWRPKSPPGSLALLLIVYMGPFLPLALMIPSENLERGVIRFQKSLGSTTQFSKLFLTEKRTLDVSEQVLLAKQPKPETLDKIRSDQCQKEELAQIEPINLKGRSLRHARMSKAILIGADLRGAQLQGADLREAKLQSVKWGGAAQLAGADLSRTRLTRAELMQSQLQGAKLMGTELQGANLTGTQLQGANLLGAKLIDAILVDVQLQGADLREAKLQGADLRDAQLQDADLALTQFQGATLWKTQLQGANLRQANLMGVILWETQLQGANLRQANLMGADLWRAELRSANLFVAELEGADLRETQLQGVDFADAQLRLIDARGAAWGPLGEDKPGAPILQSCLTQDTTVKCEKRYDPQNPKNLRDFKQQLHAYLAELACKSPEIAWGIIKQIPQGKGQGSSREGLEVKLKERLDDKKCGGMQGLSPEEKNKLRALR